MSRWPPPFSIAHVTPYPWEAEDNEVNAHVARVAARALAARAPRAGARAVALAGARARLAQGAARGAREQPAAACSRAPTAASPRVIAVGEVLDVAGGARRRPPALPIDVARTVEELLGTRRARLRPRARAVRAEHLQRRAAPLARAERRLVPLLQPSGCSRRCWRAASWRASSGAWTRARRACRRPPS